MVTSEQVIRVAKSAYFSNHQHRLCPVVDVLRFQFGLRYPEIFDWFKANVDSSLDLAGFESLMAELDDLEVA